MDRRGLGALRSAVHRLGIRRSGPTPLVGLSGIDGSGKTTLARELTRHLEADGLAVALISLDPWHVPRSERFLGPDPARHFYQHAFRWDAMFRDLIDPLRVTRSVDMTATSYPIGNGPAFQRRYRYQHVDLVLLEGIFLFKREHRPRYDLAWWVDCDFGIALDRARARNQEGLSDAELVAEYDHIYFPAQRIHLATDRPVDSADGLLNAGASGPGAS